MRIDVAIGVAPVYRLEPIGGGREGVADVVVAQRDGGDRGELRRAAMVESVGFDREQRADPIERAHRHRSGDDRGGIGVEHGNAAGGRMAIDASLEPSLKLRKWHRG